LVGLAKFAWAGFVLECQKCGVIYRSRQQWYGNTDPEHQGVVFTEIAHVWPGVRSLQGTHNAARRVLDSVTALSGTVSEVSGAPAANLARWAADQVAPAYWRPNAEITSCRQCLQLTGGQMQKLPLVGNVIKVSEPRTKSTTVVPVEKDSASLALST